MSNVRPHMTPQQLLGAQIPTIATAVSVAALVIAAFRWANRSVAEDLRDSVSLWILGEPGPQANWSRVTTTLFQVMYGPSYLSARAVGFSVGCTLIAAVAGLVPFLLMVGEPFDPLGALYLLAVTFGCLAPVFFTTYLKARWLQRRIIRSRTEFAAIALLGADLLVTALIMTVLLNLVLFRFGGWLLAVDQLAIFAFLAFVESLSSPVVISASIPSVLVALAAAAGISQRLVVRVAPHLGRASKFFSKERVEKEPLILIGEVLGALVFVAICLFGVFSGAA